MKCFAIAAPLCLLFLLSCSGSDSKPTAGRDEPPSAAQLYAVVSQIDPFQSWAQLPERQGVVESKAPHGPMARIWINDQVEDALLSFSSSLPDGSIIVKENLGESDAEKAKAWTIMWKVAGIAPENGDWYWVSVTPDGVVNAEGQVNGCISCHSSARENDFVFSHQFDDR